jgi:hypothetical protein
MTTRIVDKPWGNELIWADTDHYVGKILHIKKGHSLSLQYHTEKDETVMVLTGRMEFVHYREGEEPRSTILLPRQPFHVAPLLRHRMIALDDGAGRRGAPRGQLRPRRHLQGVAVTTSWASAPA